MINWRPPFLRAFRNGFAAAMNGIPITSNPYHDLRGGDRRPTWALVWSRAWADGWKKARGA